MQIADVEIWIYKREMNKKKELKIIMEGNLMRKKFNEMKKI